MRGDENGAGLDPFVSDVVPRRPYPSSSYRQALSSLYYSIEYGRFASEYGRGLLALVGLPGSGKSIVVHQLEGRMKLQSATLMVRPSPCDAGGFLTCLLAAFGHDCQGWEVAAMRAKLEEAMWQFGTRDRFVLIVDDAQHLDKSAQNTVSSLMGRESSNRGTLAIVLAGTPEWAARLTRPPVNYPTQQVLIAPLDMADTEGYISHRLRTAGWSGSSPFTPETCTEIFRLSGGIPAKINAICSQVLRVGSVSEPQSGNLYDGIARLTIPALWNRVVRPRRFWRPRRADAIV
jgi:general secretion pathway protein A